MKQRQQNSTSYPLLIYMVLTADGLPATGITVTVTRSKNGAAFGAASGAVSEIGNGWYSWAGHASDRDTVGPLAYRATGAGCVDFPGYAEIVPWDPFDGVRMGLTALPNATAGANGGLPLGDASGRVTVAALANDSVTAAALAGDAVTEIQAGLATAAALSNVQNAVDAVDVIVTAIQAVTDQFTFPEVGLVGASISEATITDIAEAVAADVAPAIWGYSTRTLTTPAIVTQAQVAGLAVTVLRGDEWEVTLTGLGSLVGQTKLWVSAKTSVNDTDDQAVFRILAGASGLVRLNGAALVAPIVAGDGAVVIDDDAAGDITITLKARASKEISPQDLVYDVQYLDADGQPHTKTIGPWVVVGDVTREVS